MLEAEFLVLGGTGLIGSAVCAALRACGASVWPVHSKNYGECRGARVRVVVNCNGNTYRFRANQDPVWDFEMSVASVERSLHDIACELYIYISTVDVYECHDDPARNTEDALIRPGQLDPYGFHKWVAERLVERFAPRSMILRLGTAVGQGLKKGPVYDLLQGQPLHMSPDSELTLIDTMTVALAVTTVAARPSQREIFNVTGTGSVRLREAAVRLGVSPRLAEGASDIIHRYDVANAKLTGLMPLPTSREVLEAYLDGFRVAASAKDGSP